MVRFHNKSGGPHNVAFWADSIPRAAAGISPAARSDGPARELAGAPDQRDLDLSSPGAPTGEYKFYCTPHLALGMKGKLTVK